MKVNQTDTYKTNEHANQLDDVSVGDGVEAATERIEYSDGGRYDDRPLVLQADNHPQTGACVWQDTAITDSRQATEYAKVHLRGSEFHKAGT